MWDVRSENQQDVAYFLILRSIQSTNATTKTTRIIPSQIPTFKTSPINSQLVKNTTAKDNSASIDEFLLMILFLFF